MYIIKGNIYSVSRKGCSMSKLLNIQLSAFVNNHIDHTNVVDLMTELNNINPDVTLLPNIIQGQNIDIIKGEMTNRFNISFVSPDNAIRVICMDERIDCNLSFEKIDPLSIDESLDYMGKVLKTILSKYNMPSNRLAININELSNITIEENTDIRECSVSNNILTTLDYYNEKNLIEWSTRCNSQVPVKISKKDDVLNVITDISSVINTATKAKKFLLHSDINTIPEHMNFRFNHNDIDSFVAVVGEIIKSIKDSFERIDV